MPSDRKRLRRGGRVGGLRVSCVADASGPGQPPISGGPGNLLALVEPRVGLPVFLDETEDLIDDRLDLGRLFRSHGFGGERVMLLLPLRKHVRPRRIEESLGKPVVALLVVAPDVFVERLVQRHEGCVFRP
ncbi:MAG: hypothetical protein DI565_13625 [Ancylobacter novellus]|uniref:Uncharacterized protein n=1 Tax=Ancylobacter novellus TaxID=921 RepID=A0A2W5K9M6_ANCNO|nr:MAG: hypothetical protein DI565_13625 [Ancylobacter novellus]